MKLHEDHVSLCAITIGSLLFFQGLGIKSGFLDFFMGEGQTFPLCTTSVPGSFLPEVKHLTQKDENYQHCSVGGQFRIVFTFPAKRDSLKFYVI